MYLRVAWKQLVRRFGGVNVPPGRGQRQGPRGFHTPNSPGRAWVRGPGRFGHVNVGGAGGLGGPAGRVQSVTAANTNQCDQHSAPVRKRYRAPWSQSWRVGLCPGLGGPSVRLGPLRVGESMRERVLGLMRERVLGFSAVWPLVSGRMASGLSPRGVASFVHAARAPMVPYGG